MVRDSKSRKYLLTINNPKEKELTDENLKEIIATHFTSILYYCFADEVGGEEATYHTHLFLLFSTPVRFSQIKKYFTSAHIDKSRGTAHQNRDYVFKQGKWESSTKSETNLPETRYEWGDIPNERQGNRADLHELYTQIKDGMTNAEILEHSANNLLLLNHIDKVRKTVLEEKYRSFWRDMTIVYLYGKTGVGKTRSVMEHFGYENVYRVTDYKHPFDSYNQQPVILFDEFHSQIKIENMLNYCDGYPLELPSRYSNKQACYTKVFIISNHGLENQYLDTQITKYEVWNALLRRIDGVYKIKTTNQILPFNISYKENNKKANVMSYPKEYNFKEIADVHNFNSRTPNHGDFQIKLKELV